MPLIFVLFFLPTFLKKSRQKTFNTELLLKKNRLFYLVLYFMMRFSYHPAFLVCQNPYRLRFLGGVVRLHPQIGSPNYAVQ